MPLTSKDYERYAVFAFGVAFLVAILILVVFIPRPSVAQFFAFRLTLALSAAGIGALLPGFLNFQLSLPMQGAVRAGGALALFASVWFANPAALAIDEIEPPPVEDASILIQKFLRLTDSGNAGGAYDLYASENRKRVSKNAYIEMSKNVRDPLGNRVGTPILVSAATPNVIAGVKGPFVIHYYQSKFVNSKSVILEIAGTIAENGMWRISTYTVQKCDLPVCEPIAALAK